MQVMSTIHMNNFCIAKPLYTLLPSTSLGQQALIGNDDLHWTRYTRHELLRLLFGQANQ